MKIELLEVYGFIGMLKSLKLPYKKECKSTFESIQEADKLHDIGMNDSIVLKQTGNIIYIHLDDLKLLQRLIKAGDEHAKALRLLRVDCSIKATRSIWAELDTYEVGVVNGCSESTMHTILTEDLTIDHFDFHKSNEDYIQKAIYEIKLIKEDYSISKPEKIRRIKDILPESYLQERVISFSYQTLQRIYLQRCIVKHRLTSWERIGEFIKTLPLSFLITDKYEN